MITAATSPIGLGGIQELDLQKATAIPADKARKNKKFAGYIGGWMSIGTRDRQGDTIDQDGIDPTLLIEDGWFNDDHDKNGHLGFPVLVEKRDHPDLGKAWWVEGVVLDTDRGRELMKTIRALVGTGRQFGFSVEGPPPIRDISDPRRIAKAAVWNVAITDRPVHVDARIELVKGMTAGVPMGNMATGGAALQRETLQPKSRRQRRYSKREAIERLLEDLGPYGLTTEKSAAKILGCMEEKVNTMDVKKMRDKYRSGDADTRATLRDVADEDLLKAFDDIDEDEGGEGNLERSLSAARFEALLADVRGELEAGEPPLRRSVSGATAGYDDGSGDEVDITDLLEEIAGGIVGVKKSMGAVADALMAIKADQDAIKADQSVFKKSMGSVVEEKFGDFAKALGRPMPAKAYTSTAEVLPTLAEQGAAAAATNDPKLSHEDTMKRLEVVLAKSFRMTNPDRGFQSVVGEALVANDNQRGLKKSLIEKLERGVGMGGA